MTDACQHPRDDYERLVAEAERCENCAEYLREIDGLDAVVPPVEAEGLRIDPARLPIAPWEGAGHRSWPLLLASLILAAIVAALLFSAAGIGIGEGVRGTVQAMARGNMLRLAAAFGESVRQAPMQFHVLIFAAFFGINFILFRLLKRPPRGADASTD